MATGALIRDFVKEYRELRYSNSGSMALSEIEHNAYRASLTLEITDIDAFRYPNLKTLPENSHFGYVTLFRGSTVTETIQIKYPKQRIFDINNQGIWNYHQATESLGVSVGVTEAEFNAQNEYLQEGFELPNLLCFVAWLFTPVDSLAGALATLVACGDTPPSGGNAQPISESYRAFPIATPFPDIIKFKADVPCSFLFRLELWYLVNPAVYVLDNPTDTGDQTEGESEYPQPTQGDGDGDGDEFPTPDAPEPGRDPRDYTGGRVPDGAGVMFSVRVTADPGGCSAGADYVAGPYGPFFSTGLPVGIEYGEPVQGCPAARLGFRVVFEGGFRTAFLEEGAGVYSAEIIDVQFE